MPLLTGAAQTRFRTLAAVIVPEAASCRGEDWVEGEALVERTLAQRPPRVLRQLQLLMAALHVLPLFRYGRTFGRLTSTQQTAFLRRMERSPLATVRRGVWGLRTLAFMAYYGRASVAAELGYRAQAGGWEARV